MIEGGQLAGDGGNMSLAREFERQKFRCESAAGVCMRRDHADAPAAGRVAGDTQHRGALRGESIEDGRELFRISGSKDDSVVSLL